MEKTITLNETELKKILKYFLIYGRLVFRMI
jgi:hypothetical protein